MHYINALLLIISMMGILFFSIYLFLTWGYIFFIMKKPNEAVKSSIVSGIVILFIITIELTLLFEVLKFKGILSWSWPWVLSPIWVSGWTIFILYLKNMFYQRNTEGIVVK